MDAEAPMDHDEEQNHLKNALSNTELSKIPKNVAKKIQKYIENTLEDSLARRAVYETRKSDIDKNLADSASKIHDLTSQCEQLKARLAASDDSAAELGTQLESLNASLEQAQSKITSLENELLSVKSARDAAIDEKNDKIYILENKTTELERLQTLHSQATKELQYAINEKCEALALNNDIKSKEIALQYREDRMEQERTFLNSQIANLSEEVNKLSNDLQTHSLNNSHEVIALSTQLMQKTEELKNAEETIDNLKKINNTLNEKIDALTAQLNEQREMEAKIEENYMKELDAKERAANIYKSMQENAESKSNELENAVTQLQMLLREASDKYGDLETKYKQFEMDHDTLMAKKNEDIASLKTELENANDLLKAAKEQNLDNVLGELAPSAAAASKLLKTGMSLTQVYTLLVESTEELAQSKEENRRLNSTLVSILKELEEKAPVLQRQRSEYEEVMETNRVLTEQLDSLVQESNRLKDDNTESSKLANKYNIENNRLRGELRDLGNQVCFLLKEVERCRSESMPNGEHESSSTDNFSDVRSKTLITFSDIQELQSNNQKLLRMVRDLTEKQQELESHKEQANALSDYKSKIETLTNRVTELTEAQERQTKMMSGLIRQRDMFKKLYHDYMGGKRLECTQMMDISHSDSFENTSQVPVEQVKNTSVEIAALEEKLKQAEKQFEFLKEEYKTYKEEKVNNEKMLIEQVDSMRQDILKLTSINSKNAVSTEYNNERFKILQANINTYKSQISSLEEKNKIYNNTIGKHEVSLKHLRDELLNAQKKIATSEVAAENLRMECKLLKDVESRLKSENEVLNRERQSQSMLLVNLEMIKASIQRQESENYAKLETRFDDAIRECSALRLRLQEEQDRFRELGSHLERQTEIAKTRMLEEKNAADLMRSEISQLRQDITDKNKSIENLAKKLKMTTLNPKDSEFEKKIKDLESAVSEKDNVIKSLQEQLNAAHEHMKQYCSITENSEIEARTLKEEYSNYKNESEQKLTQLTQKLQNMQEHCSELETELSLQTDGENSNSLKTINELSNTKEQLKDSLESLERTREELASAKSELIKLAETQKSTEDKYAQQMILHSTDMQTLTQVKEDLAQIHTRLEEITALRDNAVIALETSKKCWAERETILTSENEQLSLRVKDLDSQNAILHEQIQTISTQLSVIHATRSFSDSMNDSANDSKINVSSISNDEEIKSSAQLLQIIEFLRKEKDIAILKCNMLQAEATRLKTQLESTDRKLDQSKLELTSERERSQGNAVSLHTQSDILRKVETLNAITDSNRVLREERDCLLARVEELTASTKSLESQLMPLQEKINELSSTNSTLQTDNTLLKNESARWRTRVNSLVERANKTSPEDWKRLQNERETLVKMLTTEKENNKKLNEELVSLKIDKSNIEEQYSSLSREHASLLESNRKLNEDIQTLKDDLMRLTEELTKVKAELSASSETNSKIMSELANKETVLLDIRNKELQIRKIAKKYKSSYEELVKTVEDEKKKTEDQTAATDAANVEATQKVEEKLNQIQSQLETEKSNNVTLKAELESLRNANIDKEDKAKNVLKQAKTKIVQLTETKNALTRELSESRSKIELLEQSNRDEQDVRLAVIKSQYEGRLTRLEKEKTETLAEKSRELEALQQKVNLLQRQLSTQTTTTKQQVTTEKTTSDPPTANIKPMAGVAQQSVTGTRRGGETPLASIRPVAQVGPTAPIDAHSTEYMPASSSRPRATVSASTAPPESTQDMDTNEDSSATPSSHSQGPQQGIVVAMPRGEQASGSTSSAGNSVATVTASAPSVSPNVVAPASAAAAATGSASEGAAAQSSSSGVSTSGPQESRPMKRPRPPQRPNPTAKRTRVQGFESSVEVEYQVPTSSRCDQDDEGVIVVDSEEDDERCTGTMYREGDEDEEDDEEDEEMEEEQEVEGGGEVGDEEDEDEDAAETDGEHATRPESPAQSAEAGSEGSLGGGEVAGGEADSEAPAPHPQIEAISSGTEPSGTLSLGGGADDGDDSIVPSTPTLYVPRRNDGFGEAVVSPLSGPSTGTATSGAARFTFAEAGVASHHDTHADLAAALPPPDNPPPHSDSAVPAVGPGSAEGGDEPASEWDHRQQTEEDSPAVSSQGSQPSSPHHQQVGEEGREAEASATPGIGRRRAFRSTPAHSPHRADSDSGYRGRGMRSRGRQPRRHFY